MRVGFGLLMFFGGVSIGSFLNCLVWRLNHNLSPWWGRSICPRCKKKILWYDNIPLLSFILLRGRCRWCGSFISWQYPLGELAGGLLTVLVFNLVGYHLSLIYYLLISWILLALFISDLIYMTIPDQIVYGGIIIVLIYLFFLRNFQNIFSGVITALFFYLLVFATRGRGMGLGDVKLSLFIGLILGWLKTIIALYWSFLTGALVGGILVLIKKKKMGEHIPFGPFLTTGAFISLFWGEKIWKWGGKILGFL